MAFTTCLAQLDISMLKIADLSNGRVACLVNQSHFAGRHAHLGKITFLRQKLRSASRRTNQLPSAAFLQLNIVNAPAKRGRRAKSRRLLVRKPGFKKAIITLATGQTLGIFEGVQ